MEGPDEIDVSVILPCRNEEKSVGGCVAEVHQALAPTGLRYELVVVDNGSSDRSAAIALAGGAQVVREERPGYGNAIRAGLRHARGRALVYLDADGSYDPKDIVQLVGPVLRGEADLCLGNRLAGRVQPGAMPALHRYLGTPVLSWIIRWLHGVPTGDCNSGMRALHRAGRDLLRFSAEGMEFASELLILCQRTRLRYAELPIHYRLARRGTPSHLRPWRDGARHLRVILGMLLPGAGRTSGRAPAR